MVNIMDRQTKYICRLRFQNLIYASDAQAFEDLFVKIMNKSYPNFHSVKPQGSYGDMKNDGYIGENGIYYQVYGPENIEKSIFDARKKIENDFTGLITHWDGIKEFYFVVNDKYKGVGVKIHKELQELKSILKKIGQANSIKTDLIVPKDLENLVLSLDVDTVFSIIGYLPESVDGIDLDYAALTEVIKFILKLPVSSGENKLAVPDFNDKILFNFATTDGKIMSSEVADRIKRHSENYGDIEIFFMNQGNLIRSELQKRFSELYSESKKIILDDSDNYPDLRYMYMLEECLPSEEKTLGNMVAVESLFSYFFETCDIFEEPK